MATDEERNEVARRLRMSRSEWSGMGWKLWLGPKFGAVVLSDGNKDDLEGAARLLADLIEPHRGSGGRTILCAHCENSSWCGCEPGDEEGGCYFIQSVTEGEPPYNLYSLYEAVFRRRPRDKYAIEDDEVEELVDELIELCNAPGHERIQRSEPPYPDATASYKGWRAEVYDPDGVLASPSNAAADLVRSHADGKGPGIDSEALLELADICESTGDMYAATQKESKDGALSDLLLNIAELEWRTARIIRNALGVSDA